MDGRWRCWGEESVDLGTGVLRAACGERGALGRAGGAAGGAPS